MPSEGAEQARAKAIVDNCEAPFPAVRARLPLTPRAIGKSA